MTEYEMGDLLTSTTMAAGESFSLYISLLIAYLITSYMVGHKLTSTQSTIISSLYVVAAILPTWSVYTYMSRAIPVADALEKVNPGIIYGAQPMPRNIATVILVIGIFAALKFMWDVRPPKTE